jgi:UDP-N-acetyl-D-mannosaminuronic acid dehydrogenase
LQKVAVVGFGYIGSVIGAVLASRGLDVVGIDSSEDLVTQINQGKCPIPEPGLADLLHEQIQSDRLSVTTETAPIGTCDVIIVTVGTPLSDSFEADLSHIRAASEAVGKHVRDGQILMIKSTVPPGVTRQMANEHILPHAKLHIAFSPERLAEGSAIAELQNLPIVVGGLDEAATEAVASFWRDSLGVEVIEVNSPETAEMVKLADNEWIDLNVALANELAKLVDALPYEIDVLEVIRGANSLKKGQHYVNILTPSNGVGGYCLTKDPWFIQTLARRHGAELHLPETGRRVNDSMPEYVYDQIDSFLRSRSLAASDAVISLLGYSFKSNSGDCRYTPVGPLVSALKAGGYSQIRICDPTVTATEAKEHGLDLVQNWREAVKDANCVAFLAGHDEFREIAIPELAGLIRSDALIYDGRMYFDKASIAEMADFSLNYQGVGR